MSIFQMNIEDQDYISMCIYSLTGAGKTHFAATAFECAPTLYFNIEQKKATLNKFKDQFLSYQNKILTTDNPISVRKAIEKLDEKKQKGEEYDILVIDSLSRLQLLGSLGILNKRGSLSNMTEDEMTLKDHGKLNVQMNKMNANFPVSRMHIICTALAKETDIKIDKEKTEKLFRPALTGQYADLLGGWFNIVGFLEVKHYYEKNQGTKEIAKKSFRRLHLAPGDGFEAKTEFDLPDYIDNPTFKDILNKTGGMRKGELIEIEEEIEKLPIETVETIV